MEKSEMIECLSMFERHCLGDSVSKIADAFGYDVTYVKTSIRGYRYITYALNIKKFVSTGINTFHTCLQCNTYYSLTKNSIHAPSKSLCIRCISVHLKKDQLGVEAEDLEDNKIRAVGLLSADEMSKSHKAGWTFGRIAFYNRCRVATVKELVNKHQRVLFQSKGGTFCVKCDDNAFGKLLCVYCEAREQLIAENIEAVGYKCKFIHSFIYNIIMIIIML
jgi:hypothetical protein